MTAHWSFVLVKPDGLPHLAVVVETLVVHGLSGSVLGNLTLLPGDIASLWPATRDSALPITHSLLQRHLCARPGQLLFVAGGGAIECTLLTKRQMRRQYTTDTIRNVLHCPGSVRERDEQWPLLASRCEETRAVPPFHLSQGNRDRPGVGIRSAGYTRTDRRVPEPILTGGAGYQLVMGFDSRNTLDSAVTAVMCALGLPAERVIPLAMMVHEYGDVTLAAGGHEELNRLSAKLLGAGLRNVRVLPN